MGEMKVVTIEGFARHAHGSEGHPGYIYTGDAWLFRFVIDSPEYFFSTQLPNVVRVLNIDPRQIYRLALYGQPGSGLGDVRLFISFETPPKRSAIASLQIAPPEVKTGHSGDLLDDLLIDLLRTLDAASKPRLSEALALTRRVPQRSLGRVSHAGDCINWRSSRCKYGSVVRLRWADELSPSAADWSNANFILTEALREKYTPTNIVRLEFRAIPESEHGYDIEADVLASPPIKLRPIRTTPKQKSRPPGFAKVTKEGRLMVVCSPDPMQGLTESDREFRESFNVLPLAERIQFWEDHVAAFFKETTTGL